VGPQAQANGSKWGQVLQSYISFDIVFPWLDLYELSSQELFIMLPLEAMPNKLFSSMMRIEVDF
jgi:hypothetical protein